MKTAYILLTSTLQPGDVTGFTFFVGLMAMFAASVFFFFERSNVDGKWKTSLLVSGLITMIAAAHYYYMRDFYLAAIANNAIEGATFINPCLPSSATSTGHLLCL